MSKSLKKLFTYLSVFAFAFTGVVVVGCDDEPDTPAQMEADAMEDRTDRAEEQADRVQEATDDAAEDAADDVDDAVDN